MAITVLIVDDEKWVLIGMKQMLEKLNLPIKIVGTAENGIEAMKLLLQLRPDVLITDIRMPGMDGLELMEKMKNGEIDSKVVLVTGFAEFEYAQKALRMGAVDYLLKPLDKEKIQAVMEKICRKYEKEKDDCFEQARQSSLLYSIVMRVKTEQVKDAVSLGELAEQFNVSKGYLSSLLKKEFGIPYTDYITNKRMEQARNLLADTRLSIEEVAEAVGYKDYFYFIKVFKKCTGSSPSQYRKTILEKILSN